MDLVVDPYVAGPNTDLEFYRYVSGLVNSTTNATNTVLTLQGDEAFLFHNRGPSYQLGNRMFIRPVFAPLTVLINQGLDDSSIVMLTGTPGVGKTTMRNWYVKHLLTTPFGPDEEVRTIFLHTSDKPRYYMIRMERMAVVPAPVEAEGAEGAPPVPAVQVRILTRTGQDILADRKAASPVGLAYSLVDVDRHGECKDVDDPSRRGDRLVLFSSPSNEPIDKFRKQQLETFYMPVWTLTELQDANAALGLGIPPATLIDRYKKIDGMARYVFSRNDRIFDAYVTIDLPRRAVRVAPTHTAELVSASTFSGSAEFLHSLAYFFVPSTGLNPADYDFTTMKIRWATKFIITEVIGKALDDVLDKRIRNAPYLHLNVSNPSMVGYMYEGWTIRKLLIGGLTGMRWTAPAPARNSRFTRPAFFGNGNTFKRDFTVEYVDRLQMPQRLRLANAGTLLVPTSFNYPVIDCVMKANNTTDPTPNTVPLFASVQITVAHSHALTANCDQIFSDLMELVFSDIPDHYRHAHIRDRSAIFYFVPPSQFDSFRVPVATLYPGRLLKLTLDPESAV